MIKNKKQTAVINILNLHIFDYDLIAQEQKNQYHIIRYTLELELLFSQERAWLFKRSLKQLFNSSGSRRKR